MSFIFYVLLTGIVGVLFFLVSLLGRQRRRQREFGFQLLQALRMLVKHIQVHRGFTALYISGNADISEQLNLEANAINNDIDIISGLSPNLVENEDWRGITQHWARLSARNIRFEKYDYYEQHCKLVASCLTLMRSIAFEHNIHHNFRPNDDIFWYELLQLGEMLGQLRALGTMHLCNSTNAEERRKRVTRIRLCTGEIEAAYVNSELRERIGKHQCDEINHFLAIVEHYIINNKAWITSDRYFSIATETMEIIYTNFDEEMQNLLKQI
ncbi:MAG: hypothetical protein K6L76_07190 [Agarilytica sp.]